MSTGTEDPVADKRGPACAKLSAMRADRLQPKCYEQVGSDGSRNREAQSGGGVDLGGDPYIFSL